MSEKARQFLLFFGDAILLYASLFLALSLRNQHIITFQAWNEHWPIFTVAFVLWIITFYIAGIYTLSNIKNDLKFYVNAVRAMGINILIAAGFFYAIPQARLTPKTILLLTGVLFFIVFIIWRQLGHRWVSRTSLKQKALIIGNSNVASYLTKLLDSNPQLGYAIAAHLPYNISGEQGNIPDYRDLEQLSAVLDSHHIDMIVLDKQSKDYKKLIQNLYALLDRRLEFVSLDEFYELITKRVSLELIDQFWFLENLQEGKRRSYDGAKRAVDLTVATAGGVLALILMPILIVLIALTSGRPVFFTQERLGKNGRPFRAIKLRTMVRDAEKHGPQWATKNDPRVTPLGRLLRKTRLDELPQLWNILRGDMSFVGPRPERPEFVKTLERDIPFYRDRLLIKPGLTGWAQISYPYGGTIDSAKTKLSYDLYYIKNRTLVLDLAIILRTIKTVISGGGQ